MMITAKKLFDLNWNNKCFTIFITDNNRRTFLEKTKDGNYIYPSLEDFIYLNRVYNNFNQTIYYAIPKFTFEEKVRLTSGLLSIVLLASSSIALSIKSYEAYLKDSEVVVTSSVVEEEKEEKDEVKWINIKDTSTLDSLGYAKVSPADVHKAIDENYNLNDKYKILCHFLVNEVSKTYPDADLRTFYFNIKDLKTKDGLSNVGESIKQAGVGAYYSSSDNQIVLGANADYGILAHEFSHPFRAIYKKVDNNMLYYNEDYNKGSFLNEVKTCEIANLVCGDDGIYAQDRAVANFLESCEAYDITEFLNHGISDYIERLKSKYPDIDIDFIIDSVDSIRETGASFGINISLDANIYLLDELFKVCMESTVKGLANPYEKFSDFAKLLEYTNNSNDLFYSYLEKFNAYLTSLEYKDLISPDTIKSNMENWQNYFTFGYGENGAYPIKDILDLEMNDMRLIVDNLPSLYLSEQIGCLKYPDMLGERTFWANVLVDGNFIDSKDIKPVKITLNNEVLSEDRIYDLYVQVGCDKNKKPVYRLGSFKKDSIIYQSQEEIINPSLPINLMGYLGSNRVSEEISITDYFNDRFLAYRLLEKPNILPNVSIPNCQIQWNPYYVIVINHGLFGEVHNIDEILIAVDEDNNFTMINSAQKIEGSMKYIPVKEILSSKGILNETEFKYTFQDDEFNNIIKEYLEQYNLRK